MNLFLEVDATAKALPRSNALAFLATAAGSTVFYFALFLTVHQRFEFRKAGIERKNYNGTDAEGNAESICGQPKIQQHHRDYRRDERDVPERVAAGDGVCTMWTSHRS